MGKPNIQAAENFARIHHGSQTYGDKVHYSHHTNAVRGVLTRFGFTDDVFQCAAELHDVIEDTRATFNDVKADQGEEVAQLVYDVSSELGRNRKERNVKTYPKIKANPKAIILKLADRIANVEYGLANGGKTDMYREEFKDFYEGIYVKPEDTKEGQAVDRMWKHLMLLLSIT